MYYISEDPNYFSEDRIDRRLYHLKDKNGNVVDSRFAMNATDAKNTFLSNNKELRDKDIEVET